MNYYNEFDPNAAAWLRQLIAEGLIPPGEVDQRSITDVSPSDLSGFSQCHFFAGIGGWSRALQLAGWPASRPVWTGSCPCQPFSAAGHQKGNDDERHLWPAFFELIRVCRPDTVFGEQVEAAVGHGWLDGIRSDLEGEGYALGDATLGAHSVGSPHIRQRLYWVAGRLADPERGRCQQRDTGERVLSLADPDGPALGLAHGLGSGLEGHGRDVHNRHQPGRVGEDPAGPAAEGGAAGGVDDGQCQRRGAWGNGDHAGDEREQPHANGAAGRVDDSEDFGPPYGNGGGSGEGVGTGAPWERVETGSGLLSGWDDSTWIPCRDGKYRRVPTQRGLQPVVDGFPSGLGTGGFDGFTQSESEIIRQSLCAFPLAIKVPHRTALLKGAGNAIVPQVAALFIEAFDTRVLA